MTKFLKTDFTSVYLVDEELSYIIFICTTDYELTTGLAVTLSNNKATLETQRKEPSRVPCCP